MTVPLGLWFRERLDPAWAGAWSLGVRAGDGLDLVGLRTAWRVVGRRHPGLRTGFAAGDAMPRPRVADEPDLDSFTEPGAPVAAERWAAECPLPRLDSGPLASLDVARLDSGGYAVRLAVHAAVADEDSLALLAEELSAEYARAVGDPAAPGPAAAPGPVELRAHAPESVAWWARELTPPPAPLDLPADSARPEQPVGIAGEEPFQWPAGPVAALAGAAGAETVLLVAYQALLHRLTGADRVPVGVIVSLRPAGADGVVGAFDNLVPHVVDCAGRTFGELLAQAASRAEALAEHVAVPFAEVVRAAGPERDPRRTPLCDAVFTVRRGRPTLTLSGVDTGPLSLPPAPIDADLALCLDRAGETVAGVLRYRAALFAPESARRLLAQLRSLLAAAAADPDRPIAELPLDSAADLRADVRAADLVAEGAPDARVSVLVARRAAEHPDAPAVSWNGAELSYRDLRAAAGAVAAELTAAAGTAVAVRMATGPRLVATLVGVLDADAHVVCLGQADAGERGRAVLEDLRPGHLLVDGIAADGLADWYAETLGGAVVEVAGEPGAPSEPVTGPVGDRAYVTYTSGSTGAPKGIPQDHATLAQFVTWFAAEFGIGPGSRVAQWAAPGYDAGLVEVFAALAAGATLCPVPDRLRANPDKLVDWLAAERITVLQTVPSFARGLLARLAERGGADDLVMDHLLLAGEALPGELARGLRAALPGVRLVNLYGPTETILATWHEVSDPVAEIVPIGQSIPGRHVLVVDAEDRPCPRGVTGELVIRTPYRTAGYLGAAAGERAAFAPLPGLAESGADVACYRTGDLARRRWDGALEYLGRRDFQVKFNGVRLELADIEAALTAHESVAECVVVAVPGADGLVARLVGHVVPRRGSAGEALAGPDTWRTVLRRRFGRAMPPVTFTSALGLPRTVGGKVDRRGLPAVGASAAGGVPAVEPLSALTELWAEVLGVADPEPTTGFFAEGGHSGLALRLLAEVHGRLGARVSLRDFLTDPTLAGLSAFVVSQSVSMEAQYQPTTG